MTLMAARKVTRSDSVSEDEPGASGDSPDNGDLVRRVLHVAEVTQPYGDQAKFRVIDRMIRELTGCPWDAVTVPAWRSNSGNEYSYAVRGESAEYRRFRAECSWWYDGTYLR